MPHTWDSPLKGHDGERAIQSHPVWAQIRPRDGKGGFVRSEFDRPDEMDAGFLSLLYMARLEADVPFRVISDARDPRGDVGAEKSAHKKRPCRAVDLEIRNSYERARIVIACVRVGFVRIGIYPGLSVHVDGETDPENPSPRIWTSY